MKPLQEILNEDLSPEKVKDMDYTELSTILISNNIIANDNDIRMLIVEAIQRALNEDDEFPIHYYDKTEPMSETGKVVENPGDMLTDEVVKQMKGTN